MRNLSTTICILRLISLTMLLVGGAAWLLNLIAPVARPVYAQTQDCYQPWLKPPLTNPVYLPVVLGSNPT